MAGFQFRETMSGSFHLVTSPTRERAMSFTVGAYAPSTLRFLRDRTVHIQGEVDLEGFTRHRPLRGTMVIDPLLGRRIAYDFVFTDDDGRKFRVHGQKTIDFFRLLETMTTLPATISDDRGVVIGEARLRFDARSDLAKFVRSWKRVAL